MKASRKRNLTVQVRCGVRAQGNGSGIWEVGALSRVSRACDAFFQARGMPAPNERYVLLAHESETLDSVLTTFLNE